MSPCCAASAEPVTDVTPIPVATTALGADLSARSSRASVTGRRTRGARSAARRIASLQLRPRRGPASHAAFPTCRRGSLPRSSIALRASALLRRVQGRLLPRALRSPAPRRLRGRSSAARRATRQVCHGDSGGPLLKGRRREARGLWRRVHRRRRARGLAVNAYSVYATFGSSAQTLFAAAASDP